MTSSVLGATLRPFMFAQTAHFLHELTHFARSTLDIASYDKRAQYDDTIVENRTVRKCRIFI